MNIFSLIGHMGLLIHMGKDVKSIIDNLVNHKENFPSVDEFVGLIEDALQLLGSGLLGLPDPVVKQMTDALSGLKVSLKGS